MTIFSLLEGKIANDKLPLGAGNFIPLETGVLASSNKLLGLHLPNCYNLAPNITIIIVGLIASAPINFAIIRLPAILGSITN